MTTTSAAERYDLAAEQAVLGAMMCDPRAVADAEEHITAASFYRPAHTIIWQAIVALRDADRPVDAVSVAARLAADGALGKVGGGPYLHDLFQAGVPQSAGWHARIVAAHARVRTLAAAVAKASAIASSATVDTVDDAVDAAAQALADVDAGADRDGPVTWAQMIPEVMDEIESGGRVARAVTTGHVDLDRLLGGGLCPGELTVVAARPGLGKSVFVAGVAAKAAARGVRTLVVSLEMTRAELGCRLVSAATRVPHMTIKSGRLSDADWDRVARHAAETEPHPLHIDDTPGLSLGQIRAACRRIARRHGDVGLLVIDYLQLIQAGRAESRQVAVAGLSRGLKLLAKQVGAPVLVAAQLNRNAELRADRRPTLSDLRESGAIEADADSVILIHRDDAYDPQSPRAGEADLILAKNRHGPCDTITVAAQLHLSRFVDMALPDREPG